MQERSDGSTYFATALESKLDYNYYNKELRLAPLGTANLRTQFPNAVTRFKFEPELQGSDCKMRSIRHCVGSI